MTINSEELIKMLYQEMHSQLKEKKEALENLDSVLEKESSEKAIKELEKEYYRIEAVARKIARKASFLKTKINMKYSIVDGVRLDVGNEQQIDERVYENEDGSIQITYRCTFFNGISKELYVIKVKESKDAEDTLLEAKIGYQNREQVYYLVDMKDGNIKGMAKYLAYELKNGKLIRRELFDVENKEFVDYGERRKYVIKRKIINDSGQKEGFYQYESENNDKKTLGSYYFDDGKSFQIKRDGSVREDYLNDDKVCRIGGTASGFTIMTLKNDKKLKKIKYGGTENTSGQLILTKEEEITYNGANTQQTDDSTKEITKESVYSYVKDFGYPFYVESHSDIENPFLFASLGYIPLSILKKINDARRIYDEGFAFYVRFDNPILTLDDNVIEDLKKKNENRKR